MKGRIVLIWDGKLNKDLFVWFHWNVWKRSICQGLDQILFLHGRLETAFRYQRAYQVIKPKYQVNIFLQFLSDFEDRRMFQEIFCKKIF